MSLPPNPWKLLPEDEPFVLEEDRALVDSFNQRAKKDYRIHVNLRPEPFLGRPDAPVVLLNLNPGWDEKDAEWHTNQVFAELSRANLMHASSPYPFYLLNPKCQSSPGHCWWTKKLRWLVERVGLQTAASRLFCVEYSPYHSKKFGSVPCLPSQQYGLQLVQAAMKRSAIVVIMRSGKRWLEAVPSLRSYELCFQLSSPQGAFVSPRNCPPGKFEEVVCALLAAETL
jgi:hypothetical protein